MDELFECGGCGGHPGGIFGHADGDGGVFETAAGTDADGVSVEEGGGTEVGFPEFVPHGVEDDADLDFLVEASGDGDAEVGDAVEVVHGAIDGIDDPLPRAGLVPRDAFFAVDGMVGECLEDDVRDEVLALNIEVELDVVLVCGGDVGSRAEV